MGAPEERALKDIERRRRWRQKQEDNGKVYLSIYIDKDTKDLLVKGKETTGNGYGKQIDRALAVFYGEREADGPLVDDARGITGNLTKDGKKYLDIVDTLLAPEEGDEKWE